MAYRWLTLLSPLDPAQRPPLSVVMRVFFVSTFVGTFLPASVGGDAVRAYGLSREGVGGVDAVASVMMDRLLGVVSILLVGVAGVLLARDLIDIRVLLPALGLLAVACLAALAVVFSSHAAALDRIGYCERLPRGRDSRALASWRPFSDTSTIAAIWQTSCSARLACRCCACCRPIVSAWRLG